MTSTCIRNLKAIAYVAMLALSSQIARAADAPDPTDPEIERKTFKIADGFEVNLFASEPMIAKPIQMNWDPQGRLWVASSSQYPQIKPGEAPADKVIVLEDANNDGVADKSTVFADGLLIPTGVLPGDGGVYVANSTEVLHLKDTDGDGKADQRRVVLSGFGTEDTHHIIHTFRWGLDGRFYFNQSVYIHSHVETPHGVKRLNGSGIWRFRPESGDFDVFSRGMCNPWGHAFDDWGQSFGSDGAGDGGVHYVFPGSAFPWAIDYERVLQGMNPGSPKFCGLEIVGGRHLPNDWQGNAITNDFRANRVVRFQISDRDGTFVSKQMPDVITSTDVAFRPIDVKMGPDGAIYIADWYNPIINHGEVDFRDPRRDKSHGRIWRITAKGRAVVEKPKLVGVPVAQVLEQLKSAEPWTRQQAKVVLRSLGAKDVLPALETWLKETKKEHDRVEALWVYQAFDVPQDALLRELLKSQTPQARAAATRVLGDWIERTPDAIDLLAAQVVDANPRVRVEAIRALARVPSPKAMGIAMRAMDQPRDASIDHALWLNAKETESRWVPAFASGELQFDKPEHASFALQAAKSQAAAAALAKLLRDGKTPQNERGSVLDFIASYGGADEAKQLYEIATGEKSAVATRAAALAGLDKMVRRNVVPAGADASKIAALVNAKEDEVRIATMRLAGAWRAVDVRGALMKAAEAPDAKPAIRQAAVGAMVELGGESADFFRKLDSAKPAMEVRVAAIVGLSALDLKDAANRAAGLLSTAPAGTDPAAVIDGFLKRDGGGDALAAALASKKIAADLAMAALKRVESTGREEKELSTRLRNATGTSSIAAKALTKDEMTKWVSDAKRYGDAARGEMIFRRADTGCFKCHAIQGAGGQLGPDLGSIGRLPHRLDAQSEQSDQGRLRLAHHQDQRQQRAQRHQGLAGRQATDPARCIERSHCHRARQDQGSAARRIVDANGTDRRAAELGAAQSAAISFRAGETRRVSAGKSDADSPVADSHCAGGGEARRGSGGAGISRGIGRAAVDAGVHVGQRRSARRHDGFRGAASCVRPRGDRRRHAWASGVAHRQREGFVALGRQRSRQTCGGFGDRSIAGVAHADVQD
jgi:glucose/arabinose dehydrogenase/HEAT repeat protein